LPDEFIDKSWMTIISPLRENTAVCICDVFYFYGNLQKSFKDPFVCFFSYVELDLIQIQWYYEKHAMLRGGHIWEGEVKEGS
jgi:hypothetical protein